MELSMLLELLGERWHQNIVLGNDHELGSFRPYQVNSPHDDGGGGKPEVTYGTDICDEM
jgi:hypothetical protein